MEQPRQEAENPSEEPSKCLFGYSTVKNSDIDFFM